MLTNIAEKIYPSKIMLKQLRLFFFYYNKALKTNVYYFICPKKLLPLVHLFYSKRLISIYYVTQNKLFIYLPSFAHLVKNYNFKYYRTYVSHDKIQLNGLYLTTLGLQLGVDLKKKKLGGRLLYLL